MRVQLIRWELRKLCAVPMFWIFIALCIALNCILVLSNRFEDDYISYVARVTDEIGGQMGAEFDGDLDGHPDSEYKEALKSATYGAVDVLDGYNMITISDYYISTFSMRGAAAELLESKFRMLQSGANDLADTDATLSLAAADGTGSVLKSMFILLRAILAETAIMAVLLALYSCRYEELNLTASGVYSSRVGRSIQKSKLLASAIFTICAYAVIALFSVGIFTFAWKLGSIWGASISSQFHFVDAGLAALPFITWIPFTIAEYLAATLVLGAAFVLVFHLIGYISGLLVGNVYVGFLIVLAFVFLEIGAIAQFGNAGNWLMYQLLCWTPVPLWLWIDEWFSGVSIGTVLPFQECLTVILWLIILSFVVAMLYRSFMRKDVTELAS